MQGYTFSKDVRPGLILETYVGEPFPTGRIRQQRYTLSHDPVNELRGHMPVQGYFRQVRRDFRTSVFALIIPFVVACLMTYVLVRALRAYHVTY
jgi:hypothetical protein